MAMSTNEDDEEHLSTEEIRLRWLQADTLIDRADYSDEENAEHLSEWCHWFAMLKDRGYEFNK